MVSIAKQKTKQNGEQTMTDLLQKRMAEVEAVREAQKAAELEAKLASDKYVSFLLDVQYGEQNFNRLKAIATSAKDFKAVKRATGSIEVRFNKSYMFTDEVLNYLIGAINMVQYAPAEYKRELEAMTGLDELTIAEFNSVYGNQAYFSKVSKTIVPAKPTDVEGLKFMLQKIASKMELKPLNMKEITQDFFDNKHATALNEAQRLYSNHMELTASVENSANPYEV